MTIASFKRPRNVVIVGLAVLALLHFVFFYTDTADSLVKKADLEPDQTTVQQKSGFFQLLERNGDGSTETNSSPSGGYLSELQNVEERRKISRINESMRESIQREAARIAHNREHRPGGTFREEPSYDPLAFVSVDSPPETLVEDVFGDGIMIKGNQYAQKPSVKKIRNEEGKIEIVSLNGGIQKFVDFGNPANFDCDDQYCAINGRQIKKDLIKETPHDMFTFLPPKEKFHKSFRNPCWTGEDLIGEERLFCIPYFYIIGFTKCGTTDMFSVLKAHPLISSRAGKETHFMDRLRRGRSMRMNGPVNRLPQSFLSWTNAGKFRINLLNTYKKNTNPNSDILFHGITMDATPAHVWDNEYWETFHPGRLEPPVTSADVISTISPEAKIIVALRDPIKRMQSAYQFFCAFHVYDCDTPVTPTKFKYLVNEAIDQFESCQLTNTVRGCTYSTGVHQLATHLYASIYSVYLKDFFKVIPREQIHIIKFEDHIEDEVGSFNEICDFLGVPRYDSGVLTQYLDEHKVRNSLKDSKRIDYIPDETIQRLKSFFKPHLDELVELLGDEKWYWNYY